MDVSCLEHLKNGTLRNKRTIATLTNKYHLESKTIKEVSEKLKQRITATAKKIDRYDARNKFRQPTIQHKLAEVLSKPYRNHGKPH